jgi:L-ascorbate metabolism protein UlaG (beta-lactamase superfamily)
MEIKWYGTATMVFSSGGQSILMDPFFPMNKDLPSPPAGELASFGDIFITHGHFDHLIDVPRITEAGKGRVYCSETSSLALIREGVDPSRITAIEPGDLIELGPFKVRVFGGKHIKFNGKLILKTLFSRRVFTYRENLRAIVKELRRYPMGQVLVFLIEAEGKKALHLGSLNLDHSEQYPPEIDLLSLPYQGRSDLSEYTLPFIRRFEPELVYLHHFDDSFPPVSSQIDPKPLINVLKMQYPHIRAIVPRYGEVIVI